MLSRREDGFSLDGGKEKARLTAVDAATSTTRSASFKRPPAVGCMPFNTHVSMGVQIQGKLEDDQ